MSFRLDLQERLRQIEITLDTHINRGAKTEQLIEDYNELVPMLTPEQIDQLDFDPSIPLDIPESYKAKTEPVTSKKKDKKNKPEPEAYPKVIDCSFCHHPMELQEGKNLYVCTNCPHTISPEKVFKG